MKLEWVQSELIWN